MTRPRQSRERIHCHARFRMRERARCHAYTLIEVLIVIAMLAVLTGAFFTVVMFSIRAEREEDIRSTLRQEGLGLARAIVRDAHLTRSAGRPAGVQPATIRSDSQTLILETGAAREGGLRAIAYRVEGRQLKRMVWNDTASTPTVQTMSDHVRTWRIERSGRLVRVAVELALNRYEKDFTMNYAFTTSVGGVFSETLNAER